MNTALVTGAASGIGEATCRLLAARGYAVVGADIDGDGLAQVESLAGRVKCDVTRPADCAAAVEAAVALGPLSVLVNSAGVTAEPDNVEALSDAQISSVWEINVGSIFRMARAAIPRMRAAGGGTIVNLASVHAYASMRDNAVYAATKGAIVSLTTQMALDLSEDKIRVVALAPGSIDTPMTRYEFSRRGLTAQEAGFGTGPGDIGRVATADEVAEVIAWLASPAASLINATTITTDAGLMARLV